MLTDSSKALLLSVTSTNSLRGFFATTRAVESDESSGLFSSGILCNFTKTVAKEITRSLDLSTFCNSVQDFKSSCADVLEVYKHKQTENLDDAKICFKKSVKMDIPTWHS